MGDRRALIPVSCEYVEDDVQPARIVLTLVDDDSTESDVIDWLEVDIEFPWRTVSARSPVYVGSVLRFALSLVALHESREGQAMLPDWDGIRHVSFDALNAEGSEVGISGVFWEGLPNLYSTTLGSQSEEFLGGFGWGVAFQGFRTRYETVLQVAAKIREALEPMGIGPEGGLLVINDSGYGVAELTISSPAVSLSLRDVGYGEMRVRPFAACRQVSLNFAVTFVDGKRITQTLETEMPCDPPYLLQTEISRDGVRPRGGHWEFG